MYPNAIRNSLLFPVMYWATFENIIQEGVGLIYENNVMYITMNS